MTDTVESEKITYHLDHAERFAYTLARLAKWVRPGGVVADIGCHRLDFAAMAREAGYEVVGFDVPEFLEKESVQRRARELGVRLVRIEDLGRGVFAADAEFAQFDAMIFAEILEHITFNPLEMWRVLFSMLRPDATLLVTTPNSMSLEGTYRGLARILKGRGQGIPIDQIFSTVTYGHHWKEYSKSELIDYFTHLGIPAENITVEYVNYKQGSVVARSTFRSAVKKALLAVDRLKPDLFCTVSLKGTRPNVPASPKYLG